VTLSIVGDRSSTAKATGGFLDLRRLDLVARYPSGAVSKPFSYDIATRAGLDAVIVVAHYKGSDGVRWVYLRSCARPPVALRTVAPFASGNTWEVPAGIIEGEDPRAAAARELLEEVGFEIDDGSLAELGPYSWPAPGVIGERHVYFHVEVDPSQRRTPSEDGSELEREGEVIALRLDAALEHARSGELRDAKTELALRRLAELP
jgi:ADP-ribose pyrophosphatase